MSILQRPLTSDGGGSWQKMQAFKLSKWIYETVELHLDEEQPNSRLDVIGELAQLPEDKNKLRDELKLKSLLIEKYETELFKLHIMPLTSQNSLASSSSTVI